MAAGSSLQDKLSKHFKDVFITNLGDETIRDYDGISTGLPLLDNKLLAGKGIPIGKATELAGKESSGKSTLASQIVASAQSQGLTCSYIDAEHSLSPSYSRSLGVDVDNLLIAQPKKAEDALGILEFIVQDASTDLVVFDSIGALVTARELEGELSDANVGIRARILGLAMRRIIPVAERTGTTLLFINQVRQNVGAMGNAPTETTPGGKIYDHELSLRLWLRRTTSIKQGEEFIGYNVLVTSQKSRMSASRQSVTLPFYNNEGFDIAACVLQEALNSGVLTQSGSWIKWTETGDTVGQGFERVRQMLKEDEDLMRALTT